MIRRIIPLVALVLSGSAMAQVGIGTKKPASSAQLEVFSPKKGVLLPRVELQSLDSYAPIEGDYEESLLVYHVGNTNMKAGFYYWKDYKWTALVSGDVVTDRKNNSFRIGPNPTKRDEESLIVTDTQNHSVYLAVADIANNNTFVKNLVENNDFITKLGDNVEFIENIINKLNGTFGNVVYKNTTRKFYYIDNNNVEREIDWERLNTKINSFQVEEANNVLVITDTENNRFSVSIDDLGKAIANNNVFVTNLTANREFITKLGDNNDFKTIIKNNSAESKLTLTDGTVNTNNVKGGFTFNNGKTTDLVKYAETLTQLAKGTDANQMIEYSYIDETGAAATTKITVTKDVINDFQLILNDNTVKQLLEQFISVASGDISVTRNASGDIIIKTATDEFNLTNEIKAQQSITTLTVVRSGVYEYKNEDIIVNGGTGMIINVIEDVQNNFEEIIDNSNVKNILNEFLTQNVSNITVKEENGDIIFVVVEAGGTIKNVNITELIRDNSYLASVDLKDTTTNANNVKAGFEFKDGKSATSTIFAETLTQLDKGTDANQMIEYSYIDETGAAATTKITVTKDVINDFQLILNDNTVKQLLEQFISVASGDISVTRNASGDLIIKTATDEFNLTNEIKAQQSITTLTVVRSGVYEYKNEDIIVNGGTGMIINVIEDVQNNFEEIIDNSNVKNILNEFLTQNVSNITVKEENGDTIFVVVEAGGTIKNVNITELIRDNSYLASVDLKDGTTNANSVKAGFEFKDGKNAGSKVFAETLTKLEKDKDANQMIEYSYIDETGAAATTKITVTKDVINDFELILNDNTVKQLLEQFISVASGDISVTRNASGDLIIKTATDEFNLTNEIKAQQSITTLTVVRSGVYEYKNEDIIVNGGTGMMINVIEDVQNNFEEIVDNSTVKNILNEFLTQNVSNVTVRDDANGDIILTVKEPNKPARDINLTQLVQNESFVASIDLKDGTSNANSVKAGFEFKDGKNAGSKVFAETLTKLNKGQDANQMIEYSYIDETGAAANTKITVTKDIINDFALILNDNTVKQLLEQFISTTSGEVSVTRNASGDLIIKTATDEFNLTNEIKAKQSVTTLTGLGEGVYEYKNENVIVNGGDGVKIDVVKDVQNNFQKIVDDTNVTNILKNFVKENAVVVNYSTDEQIKPEKWMDTTDKIALRMFDITLRTKTNIIALPASYGDFAKLVLNARLIHKTTNSITEGVIRKDVVGGQTRLVLGTAGSFTVAHPTGEYYLILEYVKK